jgi:hypothetical protein
VANGPVLWLNPTAHARQRLADIRAPRSSFVDVLQRRFTMIANESGRGGSHLLIGRNRQGDCLTIPVEYDELTRDWVAITVWRCTAREERALGK